MSPRLGGHRRGDLSQGSLELASSRNHPCYRHAGILGAGLSLRSFGHGFPRVCIAFGVVTSPRNHQSSLHPGVIRSRRPPSILATNPFVLFWCFRASDFLERVEGDHHGPKLGDHPAHDCLRVLSEGGGHGGSDQHPLLLSWSVALAVSSHSTLSRTRTTTTAPNRVIAPAHTSHNTDLHDGDDNPSMPLFMVGHQASIAPVSTPAIPQCRLESTARRSPSWGPLPGIIGAGLIQESSLLSSCWNPRRWPLPGVIRSRLSS